MSQTETTESAVIQPCNPPYSHGDPVQVLVTPPMWAGTPDKAPRWVFGKILSCGEGTWSARWVCSVAIGFSTDAAWINNHLECDNLGEGPELLPWYVDTSLTALTKAAPLELPCIVCGHLSDIAEGAECERALFHPERCACGHDAIVFVAEGDVVRMLGQTVTVASRCSTKAGVWHCGRCDEIFADQSVAADHVRQPSRHALVWLCREHGPEAPSHDQTF